MPKIEVIKIRTLTGHRDAVYALSPAREENRFISGAGDGMIVSWNLANDTDGDLVARVPNSIYALQYIPERNLLVAGHNYEGLHFIDLSRKSETSSLKFTSTAIFDLKLHDQTILAACGDGRIVAVGLDPLKVLGEFRSSAKSARSLAIHSGLGHYAAGYSDNFIRIFDLKTHRMIREFEAHTKSVFTVIYSPDGTRLLSGSRDAQLKIWNVESGYSAENSVAAHLYAINHMTYSPDGTLLATGSMDKTIKIWSAGELRLLKVIDRARHEGHLTSVNKLFWSGFNNWLVSGGDDRNLSVWELKPGQP